jgi:hypothetical protein
MEYIENPDFIIGVIRKLMRCFFTIKQLCRTTFRQFRDKKVPMFVK